MTESTFLNEANDQQKKEFARRLDYFREVDSDLHYSFVNHISIGASVAISIVVLVALYVISSVLIEYGGAIYELTNNVKYNHDTKLLLLFGISTFILIVIAISACCLMFLVKLKRSVISVNEDAFFFRKEKLRSEK